MKKLFAIIFLFAVTLSLHAQSLPKRNLIDINGKMLTYEELKDKKVFFLIVSLTCGYCLMDMAYYNALIDHYNELTDCTFVALFENDRAAIEKFKSDKPYPSIPFLNEKWIVIPADEQPYYKKIWRKKLFPEYLIYEKGRRKESFAGSNDKSKEKIKKYLDNEKK